MERKRKICIAAVIAAVLLMNAAAVADWDHGDPYKMHWPQEPKPGGLDVEFAASALADDWMCIESGDVGDIHLWVSWMQNQVQPIPFINVGIYSDNPDPDGAGPLFSTPAVPLWQRTFYQGEFVVRDMPPDLQGWFDPSTGELGLQDHTLWQQINITKIADPFFQEETTVYWLVVDFGTLPFIGWKESGSNHFNDDSVWLDKATGTWMELRSPECHYSLDLAFVITPEPATLLLLALGGAVMLHNKRK
jgi:hypothetical protein